MTFKKGPNVYVGHSKTINFQEVFYPAIKETNLFKKSNMVLPHEYTEESFNSKRYLKSCVLMIAEGSEAATGLGIELGWADMLDVPILVVYKKGKQISGSLNVIADNFIEYENTVDLIEKINLFTIEHLPWTL